LIDDYETIFLEYADEETKKDPKQFPEFKKLYKRLKGRKTNGG
jgi:hypothetical protein